MSIRARAVIPAKFNVRAITDELEALVSELVDELAIDLNKTVATWKRKPVFKKIIIRTSRLLSGEVSTDNRIYGFVNYGTRVGYAQLSQGFRAKTVPGVIGSFPGAGHRLYVGAKPKPGVTPRRFTFVLQDKYQKIIQRRGQAYLARGAQKSGHYFP